MHHVKVKFKCAHMFPNINVPFNLHFQWSRLSTTVEMRAVINHISNRCVEYGPHAQDFVEIFESDKFLFSSKSMTRRK